MKISNRLQGWKKKFILRIGKEIVVTDGYSTDVGNWSDEVMVAIEDARIGSYGLQRKTEVHLRRVSKYCF